MVHPIVVAVSEGDQAREAVALGVSAARLLGAPLVLAGVVVPAVPGGATVVPGRSPASDPARLRDYVAGELHRQADAVADDVQCTIHVATATGVLPGLAIAVEQEHAQLLVIGASHLGPLARAVRGDIGLGAAHRVGCSVLVVPADGAGAVVDPPRRIGVAWDGGAEAQAALDLGVSLAERSGADLIVMRAAADADELGALRALESVVERLRERVPCATRLLPGPAAGALVAASAEVDLLVMGARHRPALASLWLGSIGTPVLRHAQCPVLVVPDGALVPAPASRSARR